MLGVLGPDFAREALGLATKDLAVIVLPLGFGIVMGILLLVAGLAVVAAESLPRTGRGRQRRSRG